MMRTSLYRLMVLNCVAGASLMSLTSCGLSDRQLSGVVQSALTTGLSSLISAIVNAAFGGGATA